MTHRSENHKIKIENKVSIFHIISGDVWAGAENQVYELLTALSTNSLLNIIVITFNEGILVKRLQNAGIPVHVIDERKNNLLSCILKANSIMQRAGCDIAHVHGYKEMLLASVVKSIQFGSFKIIRTFHGMGMIDASIPYRFIEKVNSFFLDYAISVSFDLQEILIKNKLVTKNKTTVLHNCIGSNQESIYFDEKDRIKSLLKIPKDAFVVGTIGRLVQVKGHKFLLEAAKILIPEKKNLYFVIVGDGPLLDKLQADVQILNLEANIIFTGFRNDAASILRCFDIFILTSLHEGIPMVILESMRAGIPIISTDVGGIGEILTNNKDALLIPMENVVEGIINACKTLVQDEQKRKYLSENALQKVCTELNTNKLAEDTSKLYYRWFK